ncbi:hypothetical protein WG66_013798 [Moniliophthora roreri]|nr:hypothetical protein WG66_013798 [Moniliophthora roreri]
MRVPQALSLRARKSAAQFTKGIHANDRSIVSISVGWPVPKSTSALRSAASLVDNDAVITSAPDLVEKTVHHVRKHASGFVHTFPAPFCVVRFAPVYHAMSLAQTHFLADIHVHPVICGEPCSSQKCVECLDAADKTDVVDFIMQRTLAEVAGSDDICDRLITLECGHMFTVETLDGHCHMSDYYEVDMNTGSYVAMKAPPVDFQSPPTCPTCRNPVTARRYGRVTKRANLDILEQNVASNMAHSLEDVGPSIAALATTLSELQASATRIPFEKASLAFDKLPVEKRLNLLSERLNEVMPPTLLTPNAMRTYHGLSSSEEGKAWYQAIKDLHTVYKKVASIARTRSAHTRAYEQALSTLYRQEFSRIAMDSTTDIKAPEQVALNNVHKMLGRPPPKADVRYYVEAFLLSIEIRFILGQVALSRIDALEVTSNDAEKHNHHRLWSSFIDFLYHACEVDCRKAIRMAEASSSSRLAARSVTMLFRAEFERFRFSVLEKRKDHVRAGTLTAQSRLELVQELDDHIRKWKVFMAQAEQAYIRSRPSQSMDEKRSERDWFRDNCRAKFRRAFDELLELRTSLERDTFYQSVSLAEKEDIVKAMGFTHRGHFYNCPNGHPFVITECGGAMQVSRCPECGATIGGSNHSLDSSNTRAREFEEIAGRQGAETSPWGWAADA